jgi:hypothetical protein
MHDANIVLTVSTMAHVDREEYIGIARRSRILQCRKRSQASRRHWLAVSRGGPRCWRLRERNVKVIEVDTCDRLLYLFVGNHTCTPVGFQSADSLYTERSREPRDQVLQATRHNDEDQDGRFHCQKRFLEYSESAYAIGR